jgi:hypothetical protein
MATPPEPVPTEPPATSTQPEDPVLARLKQLEENNASMHTALEAAKSDLKKGQERIDFLSADKRKEMEVRSQIHRNWPMDTQM